jgi:hypothetical protein
MIKDRVKFLHFRFLNEQKNIAPKGGLTVAYMLQYADQDRPTTLEPRMSAIEFEFAECSQKDHYNKRKGRLISAGRLLSLKVRTEIFIPIDPQDWFIEFEQHVIEGYREIIPELLVNTSRAKAK